MSAGPEEQDATTKLLGKLDDRHLADEFAQLSRKLRKRPLVLFFGRSTFADNSKYLFLRAAAQPRGYDIAWCTINPQLTAELQARGLPCLLLSQDIDLTL